MADDILTNPEGETGIVVRCRETNGLLVTTPVLGWTNDFNAAHRFWSVQDAFRMCHRNGLVNAEIVVHQAPQPPFVLPVSSGSDGRR